MLKFFSFVFQSFKQLLYFITGYRPMKYVEFRFMDTVTWEPVYLWKDKRGRYWLATSAWAFFRVEVENPRFFLIDE
jgi:hypothetical protein